MWYSARSYLLLYILVSAFIYCFRVPITEALICYTFRLANILSCEHILKTARIYKFDQGEHIWPAVLKPLCSGSVVVYCKIHWGAV